MKAQINSVSLRLAVVALVLLWHCAGFANATDSLKNLLSKTTDICGRAEISNSIAESFQFSNADSSLVYANSAYEFSKQCGDKTGEGISLLNIATAYDLAGNYSAALKNALDARKIFDAHKADGQLAACLHLLGRISFHQSETADGENKTGFYEDALAYYEEALAIERSLGNQLGVVNNSIEIGYVKFSLGDTQGALAILQDALKISEQFPDDRNYIHNIAKSSYNISVVYIEQDSILDAIEFLTKAVSADSVLGNKEGLAGIRLAEMYMLSGDNETAAKLALQNYDTALVYGYKLRQKQATDVLYRALANMGDFKNGFNYLLINKSLGDSLRNADHTKEITALEMNYEFEKKEKLKEEEHQRQVAKQNMVIYSAIAVIIVVLVIAVFIFRSYREKRKNNERLQHAYDIIEEKNTDILGSIRYAKRIQEAVLPPEKMVNEILPDSFILYKPKDMVSGDFYWTEKLENGYAFAVVDCTGHGVPGAFMSIIGHNAFHRVVHEFNLDTPGSMLDKLSELVQETLRQEGDINIRDGMDIALCIIRENNGRKTLEFAGANNPLYLLSNNTISEIKANKQHIGASESKVAFTTSVVELKGNEIIYIFTDGYADQFGGAKGKKFMYKPFKELLISIAHLPMAEQKNILEQKIEEWKGNFEQIDDICVMGVRIPE